MVRENAVRLRHTIHGSVGQFTATIRAFSLSGHFRFRRLCPLIGRTSKLIITTLH